MYQTPSWFLTFFSYHSVIHLICLTNFFYFLLLIKFFFTFFNQWLRLKVAFCNCQSQPLKEIASSALDIAPDLIPFLFSMYFHIIYFYLYLYILLGWLFFLRKFPDFSLRAWFDELRKKRMEELRRALELSEDSIGLVIEDCV